MSACYPNLPAISHNLWGVPGCDGSLVPEDPAKLTGPEVGEIMRYKGIKHTDGTGFEVNTVVRVLERSYVWSPEQHNPNGTHGYRRYDWSVIDYGRGKRMVVDDTSLFAILPGDTVTPKET